jgi:hypothetical protein
MKIYPKEQELGLEQKILAATIVKAECPVWKSDSDNAALLQEAHAEYLKTEGGKAFASYNDLYFVDTILVSSNMNKNDDYFSASEVWRARGTPVHKPTNIGHDMNQICGHMTRSWVLTPGKRQIIPNSRSEADLPGLIHLACSAVIYRDLGTFYQEAVSNLIVQIEADEMAVSMEAHFNDFDYALLNESEGTLNVVARNEQTAWMTGLLRIFGGEGLHVTKDSNGKIVKQERVGRYLKGITFTGKGFVENPANPDSIILTKSFEPMSAADDKKAAASNSVAGRIIIGSLTKKENIAMSENIDPRDYAGVLAKAELAKRYEEEGKELRAEVKQLETLVKAHEKAIADFEFGKKEYETLLKAAKEREEKAEKEMAAMVAQIEAAKKDKDENEKDSKEKAERIEALEKELASIQAEQASALRQTLLIKEGVDATEASEFVKVYASFTEDQFKTVAATKIDSVKAMAAIEALKAKGKVTEDDLDGLTPTSEAKEDKDGKKSKCDDDKADKSKNSIFASIGLPLQKKQ